MKVEWTAPADRDLDEIWTYIAEDNIDAADRTADRLRQAAEGLARHPALGRKGKMGNTRELIVPGLPYMPIYRIAGECIEILRAYHGARQWPPKG
ncbi:MAG TPA: type II toxin-antitoxin system RelE/ParE family toxin [Rhizomicrobium sp.]